MRTNGWVNPIDEEHCRRSSGFLLINRLKTATSRYQFSRIGMGHRSIPALVYVSCARFKLNKIELGTNISTQ